MSNRLHDVLISANPARKNVSNVYRDLVGELRTSRIDSPELDARLLICHACSLSHEQFAAEPEREINQDEFERIMIAAKRRCAREPLSRILGAREFWGLEFEIGPQTLDPRPDTETLVSAALQLARGGDPSRQFRILDLGTGSGCILISLLHELEFAVGVGTDTSIEALQVANTNAMHHQVDGRAQFLCTSWFEGLSQKFDLVVSNPPYIPTDDLVGLEPEVNQFDPAAALDGGEEGLDAYRKIVPGLRNLLTPGGWALFEIGEGQGEDVSTLLRDPKAGFCTDEMRQWHDLGGRVRCVAGKRSPKR
jgi:release factor glutamine methyltransferase